MGNHSTNFPENTWQFADHKEKEFVESPDYLHPKGTWH